MKSYLFLSLFVFVPISASYDVPVSVEERMQTRTAVLFNMLKTIGEKTFENDEKFKEKIVWCPRVKCVIRRYMHEIVAGLGLTFDKVISSWIDEAQKETNDNASQGSDSSDEDDELFEVPFTDREKQLLKKMPSFLRGEDTESEEFDILFNQLQKKYPDVYFEKRSLQMFAENFSLLTPEEQHNHRVAYFFHTEKCKMTQELQELVSGKSREVKAQILLNSPMLIAQTIGQKILNIQAFCQNFPIMLSRLKSEDVAFYTNLNAFSCPLTEEEIVQMREFEPILNGRHSPFIPRLLEMLAKECPGEYLTFESLKLRPS